MPKNISTTPITRPPSVSGEMSPKPTVVRVTMAHQSASWKGRSSSKYVRPAAPVRTSTTITPMRRKRFSRRRNATTAAAGRGLHANALIVLDRQVDRRPGQGVWASRAGDSYSVNPISIDAPR